jgi:hypothetical protein
VARPFVLRRIIVSERARHVLEHAQVVQRMDVTGDGQGELPNPGAIGRRGARQQRRFGESLVEVFDDRQRLREVFAIVLEHRHELRRVGAREGVRHLLGREQVHRHALVWQVLEIQCDPHAIRRRAAEVLVESHRG